MEPWQCPTLWPIASKYCCLKPRSIRFQQGNWDQEVVQWYYNNGYIDNVYIAPFSCLHRLTALFCYYFIFEIYLFCNHLPLPFILCPRCGVYVYMRVCVWGGGGRGCKEYIIISIHYCEVLCIYILVDLAKRSVVILVGEYRAMEMTAVIIIIFTAATVIFSSLLEVAEKTM